MALIPSTRSLDSGPQPASRARLIADASLAIDTPLMVSPPSCPFSLPRLTEGTRDAERAAAMGHVCRHAAPATRGPTPPQCRRPARPGAVTQLTVEARAPTVPVPCRHDAAAVERAGADLRERVAALDGQGHRAAADHDTEAGARLGRRRAELAAVVVAPAVRGVVTSEAAHMPIADAECAELEVARHENGRGATRLRAAH